MGIVATTEDASAGEDCDIVAAAVSRW
jgi:hypothetical protein